MLRTFLFRVALCLGLFASGAPFLSLSARANPALVVDAATGRVIYADHAREPWYPASVTKMMTTYLVFSALCDGRITPQTLLTVSANAESVVPSKMGFRPGTQLTVDNALKMMLVKSANDMAVVFAEGVGGDVAHFADMMNDAARRLGMADSYFVNPNGLPDPRNRTSARDLAILARALLTEFPQYASYFDVGAIKLGNRILKNTNGLIGRYPGVDGMKTGFICASGFNLVATAVHDGRRMIAVVLGAKSGADRTIKAAELLDYGFADKGWGGKGTLETLPASLITSPPDIRDQVCGAHRGTRSEDEAELELPPTDRPQGDTGNTAYEVFRQAAGGAVLVRGSRPGRLSRRAHLEPVTVFVGPVLDEAAIAAALPAPVHRKVRHKRHRRPHAVAKHNKTQKSHPVSKAKQPKSKTKASKSLKPVSLLGGRLATPSSYQ